MQEHSILAYGLGSGQHTIQSSLSLYHSCRAHLSPTTRPGVLPVKPHFGFTLTGLILATPARRKPCT